MAWVTVGFWQRGDTFSGCLCPTPIFVVTFLNANVCLFHGKQNFLRMLGIDLWTLNMSRGISKSSHRSLTKFELGPSAEPWNSQCKCLHHNAMMDKKTPGMSWPSLAWYENRQKSIVCGNSSLGCFWNFSLVCIQKQTSENLIWYILSENQCCCSSGRRQFVHGLRRSGPEQQRYICRTESMKLRSQCFAKTPPSHFVKCESERE